MKNNFLLRVITGAALTAVTVGFLFLRRVDVNLFAIYVAFLTVVGNYELSSKLFLKCVGADGNPVYFADGYLRTVFTVCMLSSLLITPAFVCFGYITAVSVVLAEILLNSIICLIGKKGGKCEGKIVLSAIYPKVILSSLLVVNALGDNSFIALVMVLTVAPLTDVFAYLVGSMLKGKKLCPKISPKKTVSGAIGGLYTWWGFAGDLG
ncbi:MAG: phosphatidate cytidylyltransferase, partial [Clostridia bacterium]|nr:phosphatidate cytidylyltransferase [Clostridia bacterium]